MFFWKIITVNFTEKENEAGAENIVADASEEKPDQSREDQQV